MQYKTDDHGRLVMAVTDAERKALFALSLTYDEFDTDACMQSVFCRLAWSTYTTFENDLTDTPFKWYLPHKFGDLTDAPILAVEMDGKPIARWGFMDYQITTPQRRLMESGECVWQGGTVTDNTIGIVPGEVELRIQDQPDDDVGFNADDEP